MVQILRQESGDRVKRSSPICSGLISSCADWQVLSELKLAGVRGKNVRMVQIITTEWSQHQHELWLWMVWTFELLFTTEVIPPSRWVSDRSCKRRLGRNRQNIPSTTQRHYYNVSNWPPETFFKGLGLATRSSIYHQPTEAQLRVNIYCIFLFQMAVIYIA